MQISLNIILDALRLYSLEIHLPKDFPLSFSMCLPIPDDPEMLQNDCLYAGGLSKALNLRRAGTEITCICLRDIETGGPDTESMLSGLVIVNEDLPQTALFSLIQNRFFTILNWVHQMQATLIHNGSIQDLVDMCAPIIDNYINVSDSSLMLIAHSTKITCDDPICVAGAAHGYFPEEIIQIFRKHDLFKVWENAEAPYLDDSCEAAKYPTYHRIFKFGAVYFAHAVLTCCRNPLTPSMLDLFNIFTDFLEILIKRAWEEKNACSHIYDTFLGDLIEGNLTSKSAIAERAQYVGIPLTGQYCLFQIVTNDSVNVPIGKMLAEFSKRFPRLKFIRYQQRIVAIHHFYARDVEEQMKEICINLEIFLKSNDALCGVSLFFSSLEHVPFSYKQSLLALKYSSRLRGRALFKSGLPADSIETRIFFYEKYCVFSLIGENEESAQLWFHSYYYGIFKRLYQNDQRHKGNNLQLLYVFLSCDRNATAAANMLNMHRNNITYHISRIQELMDIRLDDPAVRYMLLLSFSLLELYGFSDS